MAQAPRIRSLGMHDPGADARIVIADFGWGFAPNPKRQRVKDTKG